MLRKPWSAPPAGPKARMQQSRDQILEPSPARRRRWRDSRKRQDRPFAHRSVHWAKSTAFLVLMVLGIAAGLAISARAASAITHARAVVLTAYQTRYECTWYQHPPWACRIAVYAIYCSNTGINKPRHIQWHCVSWFQQHDPLVSSTRDCLYFTGWGPFGGLIARNVTTCGYAAARDHG